jgi:hypothetical protein
MGEGWVVEEGEVERSEASSAPPLMGCDEVGAGEEAPSAAWR